MHGVTVHRESQALDSCGTGWQQATRTIERLSLSDDLAAWIQQFSDGGNLPMTVLFEKVQTQFLACTYDLSDASGTVSGSIGTHRAARSIEDCEDLLQNLSSVTQGTQNHEQIRVLLSMLPDMKTKPNRLGIKRPQR